MFILPVICGLSQKQPTFHWTCLVFYNIVTQLIWYYNRMCLMLLHYAVLTVWKSTSYKNGILCCVAFSDTLKVCMYITILLFKKQYILLMVYKFYCTLISATTNDNTNRIILIQLLKIINLAYIEKIADRYSTWSFSTK